MAIFAKTFCFVIEHLDARLNLVTPRDIILIESLSPTVVAICTLVVVILIEMEVETMSKTRI